MIQVLAAVALTAAALNPWTWGRVRDWWRTRKHERRDFCEVCGRQPRRIHVISVVFDDDDALGIAGNTGMSATYCGRHAPSFAKARGNPRR